MTPGNLTEKEREWLAKLRAMSRAERVAWRRYAMRVVNGVSITKALALFRQEVLIAQARGSGGAA